MADRSEAGHRAGDSAGSATAAGSAAAAGNGDFPPDAVRIGLALVEAAEVMDRLRSPGGCPWDREQTHASLAPYLIEEAHEVAEAAEAVGALDAGGVAGVGGSGGPGEDAGEGETATGDVVAALREELGDLLLQVLFHARVAQERRDSGAFDLADVAEALSAKLRRRHPHVFPDGDGELAYVADADAVNRQWDEIKRAERAGPARAADAPSLLDGVPHALPALMRAQKVLRRAHRAQIAVGPVLDAALDDPAARDREDIGSELLALVARAEALGVDAESALRDQVRGVIRQVHDAERSPEPRP